MLIRDGGDYDFLRKQTFQIFLARIQYGINNIYIKRFGNSFYRRQLLSQSLLYLSNLINITLCILYSPFYIRSVGYAIILLLHICRQRYDDNG